MVSKLSMEPSSRTRQYVLVKHGSQIRKTTIHDIIHFAVLDKVIHLV